MGRKGTGDAKSRKSNRKNKKKMGNINMGTPLKGGL